MNRTKQDLQNSGGFSAKHLPAFGEFSRQINAAGMAELVDARDLKTFAIAANHLIDMDILAKHQTDEPAETASNPSDLQNISSFGISVNRVSARGKRYAYIRGTDISLVRGFTGSAAEFDEAIKAAIQSHTHQVASKIDGWRMDAAKALHKGTKARAARKRTAYDLSEAGIVAMLSLAQDQCALTGLSFDYRPNRNADWRRRPMAPSLDRISNRRGYEPDNVRMVCVCVNIAINEWGLENFEKICSAFLARQLQDLELTRRQS